MASSSIEIKEIPTENLSTYDAFEELQTKEITDLLDGKAKVQLIDISPRIVPVGYTPEYIAVRAARVSFGYGLKTPEADTLLLNYLLRNNHTSPLEMPNVTFRLTIPKAIAIHFLRHRTGKFNEFSQRYSEVGEEGSDSWYQPLNWQEGIRLQHSSNKQGSNLSSGNSDDESRRANIIDLYSKAEEHITALHSLYHKMIDGGLAKEVARFILPMSEYTILYLQMDLNNLSKLLYLRADFKHAQFETAIIAAAMMRLIKPLFPTIISHLEGKMDGFSLSKEEINIIQSGKIPPNITGSYKRELLEKASRLGIALN